MEPRIVLLSLACFSLLTLPTLGSVALATALAQKAVNGASLIGAGLALKGTATAVGVKALTGLAVKTAAVKGALLTKGAVLGKGALLAKATVLGKGAVLAKAAVLGKGALLAKAASIGKAALLAKAAVLGKGAVVAKSAILGTALPSTAAKLSNIINPPIPSILDIISGVWSNVQKKTELVGQVLDRIRGTEKAVVVSSPILYEYITWPRYYPC